MVIWVPISLQLTEQLSPHPSLEVQLQGVHFGHRTLPRQGLLKEPCPPPERLAAAPARAPEADRNGPPCAKACRLLSG